MPRRSSRSTTDLVVLMFAGLVVVAVLCTVAAVLIAEVREPAVDTTAIAGALSTMVGTLLGALLGYLAGRGTRPAREPPPTTRGSRDP